MEWCKVELDRADELVRANDKAPRGERSLSLPAQKPILRRVPNLTKADLRDTDMCVCECSRLLMEEGALPLGSHLPRSCLTARRREFRGAKVWSPQSKGSFASARHISRRSLVSPRLLPGNDDAHFGLPGISMTHWAVQPLRMPIVLDVKVRSRGRVKPIPGRSFSSQML